MICLLLAPQPALCRWRAARRSSLEEMVQTSELVVAQRLHAVTSSLLLLMTACVVIFFMTCIFITCIVCQRTWQQQATAGEQAALVLARFLRSHELLWQA